MKKSKGSERGDTPMAVPAPRPNSGGRNKPELDEKNNLQTHYVGEQTNVNLQQQEPKAPNDPGQTDAVKATKVKRVRSPPMKKLTSVSVMPPTTPSLTLPAEEINENIFTSSAHVSQNKIRSRKSKGKKAKGRYDPDLNISTSTISSTSPTSALPRSVLIPATALTPSILDAVKASPSSTSTHSSYYNNLNDRNSYKSRTNSVYRQTVVGNVRDVNGKGNQGQGNVVGVGNTDNNTKGIEINPENSALRFFSTISTLFGFGDRDYAMGPIPRGYGLTLLALGSCYSLLRYERNKIAKCKKKPPMTSTDIWFIQLKSIEKEYNLARNDIVKTTFLVLLGGIGMPYASAVGALLWCSGRLAEFQLAVDNKDEFMQKLDLMQSQYQTGEDTNNNNIQINDLNSDALGKTSKSVGSENARNQIEPLFCRCGKFLMICGICKLGFDFTRGRINDLISFD